MPRERHIMGLFKNEDSVVSAINELKHSSYKFIRVNTPIPSHKIMDALKLKKSMVGWFTLCGGIAGFIGGFALAIYTAIQWNMIVSGKPIVAIIPFVVVGFEATILGSVIGNVLGLLTQTRLPSYKWMKYYDPRCSGEHFGVLAACETTQVDGLKDFFQKHGAEVRVFEQYMESLQP
jgi:molybdopterin-containing oxidoreductase family membrane subunit